MMIALNDFISSKGMSGSSRGAGLIQSALEGIAPATRITPTRVPGTRVGRLLQMLEWDFLAASRIAKRAGARVVIHATNTGWGAPGVKSIVVMHDTMVLDHRDLFNRWYALYARATFGTSARRADVIVTPSEHSARQIVRRWPSTAGRVAVIPWPAVDRRDDVKTQSLTARRSRSVLVVASFDRHKRLSLAVDVVAALRSTTGSPWTLEMVVRSGNDESAVLERIRQADPEATWVRLHRGVSDSALTELYRSAQVVLVPSLDEGYCLPAVEALSNGTPVVHAGRGALPEVVPTYPAATDEQDDREVLIERLAALVQTDVGDEQLGWYRRHADDHSAARFQDRWRRVLTEVGVNQCE